MSDEIFILLTVNISEDSWPFYICSFIWVRKRLNKVLGHIG